MVIMGIDPGKSGAIAMISDDEVSVFVMPIKDDGDYDRRALADWFHQNYYKITHCFIEMAAMRRGNAAQVAFTTGRGFGMLEGILNSFHVPYTIVYSQTWSKKYPHGVTETDEGKRYRMIKDARAIIARKLFPFMELKASSRCKKMHDGMVDSVLICHYGWNLINHQKG